MTAAKKSLILALALTVIVFGLLIVSEKVDEEDPTRQMITAKPDAVRVETPATARKGVDVPEVPVPVFNAPVGSDRPIKLPEGIKRRPVPKPVVGPGRRRACCTSQPVMKTKYLNGYAVVMTNSSSDYRLKLLLNADPQLPWGPPYPPESVSMFAETVQAKDGFFPVKIWRNRFGVWQLVETVYVETAVDGWELYEIPRSEIQKDDLFVIENSIALKKAPISTAPGMYEAPAASLIDNRSSDPTTLPTFFFPLSEISYLSTSP